MTPQPNAIVGNYNIRPGWKTVPLPEVAFFQEGPGLRKWQWTDAGMKVINVTNILGDGQIDITKTSRFISIEEFHNSYRHFAVDDRDIVIASSGNTYGKIGRISTKDLPLMMNTSVIRLHSGDADRLDDDYLFAFLRSDLFRDQMESFVIGSAQPNFGPTHIKLMTLPLPPLSVQQRVAAIVSAYDQLIGNSQRRIRILEAMARAVYREWFVNFRFPGHERQPIGTPSPGEIPLGWEVKKLADIAIVNRKQINSRNAPEELHYIDISSVSPGKIENITTYAFANAPDRARRVIQHGDVLWSCVRPNRRSYALALRPASNLVASTGFAVLTATQVPFTFLYLATTTDNFIAFLTSNATGTAYPAVTAATFAKASLLVPPAAILKKFDEATIPMAEQIHTLQGQIQNLRSTRDLLLPRLLSGQIGVGAA